MTSFRSPLRRPRLQARPRSEMLGLTIRPAILGKHASAQGLNCLRSRVTRGREARVTEGHGPLSTCICGRGQLPARGAARPPVGRPDPLSGWPLTHPPLQVATAYAGGGASIGFMPNPSIICLSTSKLHIRYDLTPLYVQGERVSLPWMQVTVPLCQSGGKVHSHELRLAGSSCQQVN